MVVNRKCARTDGLHMEPSVKCCPLWFRESCGTILKLVGTWNLTAGNLTWELIIFRFFITTERHQIHFGFIRFPSNSANYIHPKHSSSGSLLISCCLSPLNKCTQYSNSSSTTKQNAPFSYCGYKVCRTVFECLGSSRRKLLADFMVHSSERGVCTRSWSQAINNFIHMW